MRNKKSHHTLIGTFTVMIDHTANRDPYSNTGESRQNNHIVAMYLTSRKPQVRHVDYVKNHLGNVKNPSSVRHVDYVTKTPDPPTFFFSLV